MIISQCVISRQWRMFGHNLILILVVYHPVTTNLCCGALWNFIRYILLKEQNHLDWIHTKILIGIISGCKNNEDMKNKYIDLLVVVFLTACTSRPKDVI